MLLKQLIYSNSRNGATPSFFHKCATPRLVHPLKQIYVFLATAPTGVLPAATAGEGFAYLWSRCLIMSLIKALHHCGNYCTKRYFTLMVKSLYANSRENCWTVFHEN